MAGSRFRGSGLLDAPFFGGFFGAGRVVFLGGGFFAPPVVRPLVEPLAAPPDFVEDPDDPPRGREDPDDVRVATMARILGYADVVVITGRARVAARRALPLNRPSHLDDNGDDHRSAPVGLIHPPAGGAAYELA